MMKANTDTKAIPSPVTLEVKAAETLHPTYGSDGETKIGQPSPYFDKTSDGAEENSSFVSFSSHASTPFDTMLLAHSQNLRAGVDNIKLNICTHVKTDIDKFAAVTPSTIKNCSNLNKFTLADSLISLLSLSEKVCAVIGGRRLSESFNKDSQKAQVAVVAAAHAASVAGNSSLQESIQAIHSSLLDIKKSESKEEETLKAIQNQLDHLVLSVENYKRRGSNISTPDLPDFNVSIPNIQSEEQLETQPQRSEKVGHITSYTENFIDSTTGEELMNYLGTLKTQFDENAESGHSVISFGEPYKYTGAKAVDPISKVFPDTISKLVKSIMKSHKDSVINQCLVNRYTDKDATLPKHSDDEESIVFGSNIFTISVGSAREVTFCRKEDEAEEVILSVAGNSMYVMSRRSQDFWTHRIDPCTETCGTRYSITFRYVSQHNNNVTAILGDSNTRHLKFGSGKHTFGDKMPGCRMECFTLDQIDPNACVGYKNIFIHCGINNIKQPHANVPEAAGLLVSKLKQIRKLCPTSKIIASPILPTKSPAINSRAVWFNKLLFDFCNVNTTIGTLDFSGFCDNNSVLADKFGRYFDKGDLIHLGSTGIFTLSRLIANKLSSNPVDGRLYNQVTRINTRRSYNPEI